MKKKKPGAPKAPILRKAKVHKNEDLKSYNRKRTRQDERNAQEDK